MRIVIRKQCSIRGYKVNVLEASQDKVSQRMTCVIEDMNDGGKFRKR